MKKIILLLSCLSLLSLSAFELKIDAGSGIQYTGADGKLVYAKDIWEGSSAGINHASSTNFYMWTDISSDQAYWPKMRLEYSHIKTEGSSKINVQSGDANIQALISAIDSQLSAIGLSLNSLSLDSHLTQSTYEGYLYYEYFEKSNYPTLGFGLGAKMFDFTYRATIVDGLEFTDNGQETVPLLFFKSRYELEKEEDDAQLSFEVGAKVYVFGDSTIYDYLAKTDFMMKYNETTDLGLELGYKVSVYDIKGSDIDSVGGNMNNSGVFVGLVGHFR